MKNEKVLIIGGAGFLGESITTELIKLDYDVTIFDKNKPRLITEGVQYIKGDILDVKKLNEELQIKIMCFYTQV